MSTTISTVSHKEAHNPPASNTDYFRQKAFHYTAWGCLLAGPIIMALPPRKLDLYTFGLMVCTFVGGNEVSREHTGISMIDRVGQRLANTTASLPPKAVEMQRRLREEKESNRQGAERWKELQPTPKTQSSEFQRQNWWKNVWMGGENESWKEERVRKERDALDNGQGYFDLIAAQVWEVWNGERKTQDDSTISKEEKPNTENEGSNGSDNKL
ncbi:Bgt-228 [Blumeria graminis f. sp. tritici]|uniref:Bgt-228 n=2 Tax=Blumeria graminis f. sp. tritici TaxID=62690 RepID=A0A061HMP7_BLUGR|nr:hypothetical protein BGT96224_228 [Blumeria graminis f. sp. tritici 96224]VDB94678.1 Bgt-228 [Blumeria graminis f. sp. tritici]